MEFDVSDDDETEESVSEEEEVETTEDSGGTETRLDDLEDEEVTLAQRLADLLKENGIEFDENDLYNSVLDAVANLCEQDDEARMAELMAESDIDKSDE